MELITVARFVLLGLLVHGILVTIDRTRHGENSWYAVWTAVCASGFALSMGWL